MEFVKFTLEGRTAFFKKPDVNSVMYYSYGNIHKVALLGILGAIRGYKGYNWQSLVNDKNNQLNMETQEYPEFYSRLKSLQISIVPKNYLFNKKKQTFNNSTGYANVKQNKGLNLIVNEVWLENPSWDIYIAIDSDEANLLKDALVKKEFVYIPYLGKNDHVADITNVEIINGEKVNEVSKVDSLFIKDNFEFVENKSRRMAIEESDETYKYQEKLPISLEETQNMYEFETFIFTNKNIKVVNEEKTNIYKIDNKNISLF